MMFPLARACTLIVFLVPACVVASTAARADATEIVVTPYYVPTSIARAGSAVTVIKRDQIERSSAATVADVLRTAPGVSVTESGGVGGQALVSLSGGEPQHTLVLIDGVRVNDPASARNQFDFATFSVTDVERIEILRGPQSALYGSDAIGGVINIITRRPPGGSTASATVEAGSYGTVRTTLSGGGTVDGASLYASGTFFNTNGFSRVGDRDHGEPDATLKYAGTLRGTVDPGEGARLDFAVDGYHQASDIDKSATVDAAGYTSERDLLSAYARFSFSSLADRLDHSFTAFGTRNTRHFVEALVPERVTDYRGTSVGAEYQGNLHLDGNRSLLMGARFEQESAFQQRSDKAEPAYDDTRHLYAGYLLYQLPVGYRTNLSFAGRYDGEIGGDGFLTGRATAVYAFPEAEARVRGSIGTGAKRPTAFQFSYNDDLLPEQSIGADIGFDRTLHDGRVDVSVTGFWNRYHNLIDYEGDFITGTYENITEAETAGVEVATSANLVRGVLTGTASYTYLYSRNLATGLPLERRPAHSGAVALTYTGIRDFTATLSAVVIGARYNNDAATDLLPPYARFDLYGSYRMSDTLTVFGRVENLLNAQYQEVTGYNAPGSSVFAGLTWKK
jgi:vitamin B12 transporter